MNTQYVPPPMAEIKSAGYRFVLEWFERWGNG
jgi:hypothetical protein